MINNRWLVELLAEQSNGSATIKTNWLDCVENAASWAGWWHGPGYWQDTHIYTHKQIREKVIQLVKRNEERRRKWLESQEDYYG